MKPIRLKIKGLNSFIEQQEIDFTELTKCGFFGVFGKTGSGKSTILDAITLALYGRISRDSTNFINTNCNSASVSYEFHITSDIEREYLVMREFRLDKKTLTPKAHKCKLMEITGGNEEILAESVRDVTDMCTQIIGLGMEDFMRTVVLPQGKFSEFLKLSGKPRRDMLERLFQLQTYGDELSRKLSRSRYALEAKRNRLEGELRGYEDVSEEKLEEQKEHQRQLLQAFKELSDSYEKIEKEQIIAEEVRNLTKELEILKEKEQKQELEKYLQQQRKAKLQAARKAIFIYPSIQKEEATQKSLVEEQKNQESLSIEVKALQEELNTAKQQETNKKHEQEEKLPALEIKKKEIATAKEDYQKNQSVYTSIGACKEETVKEEQKLIQIKEKLRLLQKQQEENQKQLEQTQTLYQNSRVDVIYKQQIELGKRGTEDFFRLSKEQQGLEEEIKRMKVSVIETTTALEAAKEEVTQTKESLRLCEEEEKSLENPGSVTDVDKLSKEEADASQKSNEYEKLTKQKLEMEADRTDLEKKLEEETRHLTSLQTEFAKKEEQFHKLQQEQYAAFLRKELIDGQPCPVCGSTHHDTVVSMDVSPKEGMEKETLEAEKQQILLLEAEKMKHEVELKHLNQTMEQTDEAIASLGTKFLIVTAEMLAEKKKELVNAMELFRKKQEELLKKKQDLMKQEAICTNFVAKLTERLNGLHDSNKEKEKKNIQLQTELEASKKNLEHLKTQTKVTDFEEEYEKICKLEKQREEFERELINLRTGKEELDKATKEYEIKREESVLRLTSLQHDLENKQKEWKEIENRILALLDGRRDMNAYEKEVQTAIEQLTSAYQIASQMRENKEKQYSDKKEHYIKVVTRIEEYEKRLTSLVEEINTGLVEYQFSSKEQVIEVYLEPDKMEQLQLELEAYEKSVHELQANLAQVMTKLSGRSISKEEYEVCCNKKKELQTEREAKSEELAVQSEYVKRLQESLVKFHDLLKENEQYEKKLAIHAELEKLLRGNRFVEYVAIERLNYISLEASKRLNEISNGIYGLEINSDGEFLIRDNKNGGVLRDVSTLSGGETFMTSLALALSLSAEIQLKGTAPLELFFLDEGFGSLDEETLDIVIGSLERIHHAKLRIGIISHIEAVKNRVPVKLIVSPAESGMGGSKVKLEYS